MDEFVAAQRSLPIVFTSGDDAIPIALMGLNEGVNVFVDAEGKINLPNFYVPAYIRRYPYMLAKLTPNAEELSLCFDPTSDTIGKFDEGSVRYLVEHMSESELRSRLPQASDSIKNNVNEALRRIAEKKDEKTS